MTHLIRPIVQRVAQLLTFPCNRTWLIFLLTYILFKAFLLAYIPFFLGRLRNQAVPLALVLVGTHQPANASGLSQALHALY